MKKFDDHEWRQDGLFSRSVQVHEVTEEAIKRVDEHANGEWKAKAYEIIRALALEHSEFTADEVWDRIDRDENFPYQHEASALGAVVRNAIKDRVITVKPGAYKESRRPSAHRKPMRVWTSLLSQIRKPVIRRESDGRFKDVHSDQLLTRYEELDKVATETLGELAGIAEELSKRGLVLE